MPEPKRVRDNATGHEYSTYGWGYEGLTVLDEPAVDVRGALLPPKYPAVEAAPKPQAAKPTDPTSRAGRPATTEEH